MDNKQLADRYAVVKLLGYQRNIEHNSKQSTANTTMNLCLISITNRLKQRLHQIPFAKTL